MHLVAIMRNVFLATSLKFVSVGKHKISFTHSRSGVLALRESSLHVTQRLQFCRRFLDDL